MLASLSRPTLLTVAASPAWRSAAFSTAKRLTAATKTSSATSSHNQDMESLSDIKPEISYHNLYKPEEYSLSQSWVHPDFKMDEMKDIKIAHLQPKALSDRIAWRTLCFIRSSFDLVTGYKHPPPGHEQDPKYAMTEKKWLQRFVFLESIAGVPGMVGGMVRHLHSLRLLRRDRAWIETLLEEAYNERMHLLTFIKLTKPGWMMRLMLLGAQGVFFNAFFVAYLIMPRICHRFVGYLEEEAVITYSRCIEDMEAGKLPEFSNRPAPDIALQYWHMPEGSTVKDLIYYVRADESKHREVNHTFGNLVQVTDPNPYALKYNGLPSSEPRPTKDLKYESVHPVGWTRQDIHIQ